MQISRGWDFPPSPQVSFADLVSSPDPTLCEGIGSGKFWAVFLALGARADTAAFEQSSDLIGQQCRVGDSNLYSGQWRFYIPEVSESYD